MADRTGGDTEPRYPMRVVIARTGLTADALRVWERRYGVVRPQRSVGSQRLYSEDDIARLTLLRRARLAGHSIAQVARLDLPALEALLEAPVGAQGGMSAEAIDTLVAAAISATERLDATAVETALKRGAMALGGTALVDQVVSRFLHQVGERWHEGTLNPAHEHLASVAVRRALGWATDAYVATPRAARVVVATPAGQMHEFGAMLAGAAAAEEGWRVIYLGANLPAADIADAARQVEARAVALSVVYANDGGALHEVRDIARALTRGTVLFVGGSAAEAHAEALRDAGARVLSDMPALRRALGSLRRATRVGEPSTKDEG
jgi:MerR family transcriptional regulator, light-induced transcriptional regulator